MQGCNRHFRKYFGLLLLSVATSLYADPDLDYEFLDNETRQYKPLTALTIPESRNIRAFLARIDRKDLDMRDHRASAIKLDDYRNEKKIASTNMSKSAPILLASTTQKVENKDRNYSERIKQLEELVSTQRQLISKLNDRIKELEAFNHE